MIATNQPGNRCRTDAVTSGLCFLLLLLPATARSQEVQRYTLGGNDVALWNLVGNIAVEAGTGSDVQVDVRRSGPDASRVTVATGRLRGRETLRVVYPATRIIYRAPGGQRWDGDSRSTLYVSEDGTFGDGVDSWRGQRVEIRSSGSGFEASAEVRVRIPRGTRIEIHLAAGDATVSNVDGDITVDVSAANITTTGTRGALTLDTGSGEVKVTDADGELVLDAGSGDVTLTRVKGPSVQIDAGSGEVRATDVDTRELRLDTGSGRMSLRGVKSPDILLDTGSGSVDLMLAADVERLIVDAGSGSVTIGVPESLGAMVSAETGSGGIVFDFPVTVTRRGRDHFSGQLGDGRGRIEIDAGSGSIRFRRS